MKTYALLLIAFLAGAPLFGQSMMKQTLGQQGSSEFVYANNKSYFIQQSIGQASVIRAFRANNHELRQGFLQPIKAALINSGFDTEIEVVIYPNPFESTVNIQFEETMMDVITISLHHITGQLIYQNQFDPSENLSIQFDNLPVGAYVLRGQMRSQAFATKLIKR
jgi:hypothetical protein